MSEQGKAGGLKPHLSFSEQLELLKARGLAVEDDDVALSNLKRFGYYRLSGYFYPLRKTKPIGESGRLDDFSEGASLDLVIQLAEFDKKLRLIVLHGIETIEVAVRVAVAHYMGKLDPEAHLVSELLNKKFTLNKPNKQRSDYDSWLARYGQTLTSSKEEFVAHHRANYQGKLPIWAAIEVWDFGLLSKFFAGMQVRDQNTVAREFGGLDGQVLKSWLRALNFVRNVSAHHSRLWNRALPDIPVLPPLDRMRVLEVLHKDDRAKEKLFGALSCLWFLVERIEPGSQWKAQLKAHLATFPESNLVSLEKGAGFVPDWELSALWKDADLPLSDESTEESNAEPAV